MRIKLDAAARLRIPGPNLERIEQIQLTLELAGLQPIQLAHEVTIDVVRSSFVLNKRAVSEYLGYANLPELLHEYFELINEVSSPL